MKTRKFSNLKENSYYTGEQGLPIPEDRPKQIPNDDIITFEQLKTTKLK